MNDFGFALAWLAIQVALVLIPALILQSWASKREPTSGAWVATWSLSLVVILGVTLILPEWDRAKPEDSQANSKQMTESSRTGELSKPLASIASLDSTDRPPAQRLTFESLRAGWSRWKLRATEPAFRLRNWGRTLAFVALAGSGFGLIRLLIGLWAIGHCRRHSRAIDDPGLLLLVDELRVAMGCRQRISLREVPDLASPATAGWHRPILLFPDNWRVWNDDERRAVIAHELAHILRHDYVAGLVARVAVVIHFYHPLVRWMVGRLHLQQELAADALGAEFAGGRTTYLVALSSLALKQEQSSPSWPARAFLPTRRTLIRRIKMLRSKTEMTRTARGISEARKLATILGLISLTIGVATLKGPATAADEPAVSRVEKSNPVQNDSPFDLNYMPEGIMGVIAYRPASLIRRLGKDSLILKELMIGMKVSDLLNEFPYTEPKVDSTKPGVLSLHPEEIESVVIGFNIQIRESKGIGTNPPRKMHAIEMGESGGMIVRTFAPFDWQKFLRQWNIALEEVHEPRGYYYRINSPVMIEMGLHVGIYFPDARTMVYEKETVLKQLIAREAPSAPTYLQGADWKRVERDMVALAIDNVDDRFTKGYDIGRENDKMVLRLLDLVERAVFGLADLDTMTLHGEVTATDLKPAESLVLTIDGLVKLGLAALNAEVDLPKTGWQADSFRAAEEFLTKLRQTRVGRSVTLQAEGFGKLKDLSSILDADFEAGKTHAEAEKKKLKP